MKLFQLTNNPDGFASINFEGIDMASILKNGDVSPLQGKSFKWHRDDDLSLIPDCPFFIGALPTFKTKKIKKIIDELPNTSTATFKVQGVNYTAFCPLTLMEGALDKENSFIKRFRNGRIMTIESYAFNGSIPFPQLFRINEFCLFTFVTDEIADKLSICELNNLKLIECNISK